MLGPIPMPRPIQVWRYFLPFKSKWEFRTCHHTTVVSASCHQLLLPNIALLSESLETEWQKPEITKRPRAPVSLQTVSKDSKQFYISFQAAIFSSIQVQQWFNTQTRKLWVPGLKTNKQMSIVSIHKLKTILNRADQTGKQSVSISDMRE